MRVDEVRAFVAVELPAIMSDALTELMLGLKMCVQDGIRWISPENLHLTICFLGHIPFSSVEVAIRALDNCAVINSPFTLNINTINAFPHTRKPSIVWAGPDVIPAALLKLRKSSQSELGRFELDKDEEIFTPHVAMGRIHRNLTNYSRRMVWDSIAGSGLYINEKAFVDGIHLMASVESLSGVRYKSLRRGTLRG